MPVFTPSFECRAARVLRPIAAAGFACTMLAACAQPAASPRTVPGGQALPASKAHAMTPAPAAANASTTVSSTASNIASISTITLERDCNGCPTGTRLELQRNGQAVATSTGKARLGTADRVSRASLSAAEFDALARQLLSGGFFEMAEIYETPGEQDGSWATLTVVRHGAAHQVFRREDAGPAALQSLEAAITALQARLVFVPDAR